LPFARLHAKLRGVGSSKPPTSPLVWIAGGCGVLVVLYVLLSCVMPAVIFGVMGLTGMGGGGAATPATPVGTPYDLGPPSTGGPMLPPDPLAPEALDAGVAVPVPAAAAGSPHEES
jgi:hypothetical protein